MKKFITTLSMILLFSNLLNAQSNFESDWDKVQEYESKGLPKSALAEVERIYNNAKLTNNSVQIIKTILFKSKFALTLEEDAQLKIINTIKKEIGIAQAPEKNMLESILANLYWQYFQQNRYKFYNRTNTAKKEDTKDFRTWDLHTIFTEIDTHFKSALENGLILKVEQLSQFNAILNLQEKSKIYRPTVYDFIANKALEFYRTGESNLAQPSYKFEIDSMVFLGDNNEFIKADFTSKDMKSQKLQALKIYKDLTNFHLTDKNKTALIDLTLNRLDFVMQNARFSNKELIYFETLKKLQNTYNNSPISTEIDFRIAQYHQQQANKYNNKQGDAHQFDFKKAITVCDMAISKFPKSAGAIKCVNLKNQIVHSQIQLQNEKFVSSNKKSKILINYKNIDKVHFKIYKANREVFDKLRRIYNNSEKFNVIKKLSYVKSFSSNLKNEKDFQNHTTEVIVPILPQGEYLILASQNLDFKDSSTYAYGFIQVTNIALVQNVFQNKYTYQIVNRVTGKPIENAKVQIKNYDISRYNKKIDKIITTNQDGFSYLTPKNNHNQVEITVTKADNKGVFRYFNLNNRNNYNKYEYKNNKVFLFTDRSIYRPSQTVYFKGIALSQAENKSEVIANSKVTVTLKDVNNQDVKKLELITNEFGSFNGEFILPNNGLTGNYQIYAHSFSDYQGGVYFSVEEYKRPKFAAKFNKINDVFKLNDTITIKGKALAYVGSNITNAKVVYKVKRKVQYPKWWYWYRSYGFNSEAQEIAHGETTTNAKGTFEIEFLAQPDKSVNKKDLPIFTYEITADITDINGETRSTSTLVRVGYHSQELSILVADKINKKSKENKITIETKNLNGEFVATKGILKIYKVKAPKSVYRNRPWNIPDYQEISAIEYEKEFPNELYKKEENTLGKEVYSIKFDTSKSKEIDFVKTKKWESGAYIVIAEANDTFNQKIIDKAGFNLFSNDDKTVADNQFFDITIDKKSYSVGEKVLVKIGTASNDMTVVLRVEKDNKIVKTELVHLSNEIKTLSIPINKEDVGGFSISYSLVNYNSYLGGNLTVNVPYKKMDLEIETLTFRDRLLPESKETWSFKIKGNKKDKVTAEILASMYDVSLDQFKPHKWQFNPIYRVNYYPINRINASNSFGVGSFRAYQSNYPYKNVKYQAYDDLNWFGLHFGYSHFGYIEPMYEMESDQANGIMFKSAPKQMRKKLSAKSAGVAITAEVNANEEINKDSIEQKKEDNSGGNSQNKPENQEDFSNVKVRTNFNETAFFFPQLKTDKDGNVSFSFTAPESLTKWKMQLLAHTKDLHSAIKTLETVTQKELMVLPNPPRFLREGDEIVISTKIANLTNKQLSGQAELQLFDAITNKSIDVDLENDAKNKAFKVAADGNTNLSWTLHIPENIQAIQYKIIAKAENYSDGEQNVLPVLSNRMLVTETMPMWIRSNQTKTFTLDKLKNTSSNTRKNHKLTLEVTSNPAWYAVQALPYLMEYPYECAEQTFSRYYANTLASHIANSNPLIQQVFNQWKSSNTLLSNLEKNQELKSLIIQETPWLRDAQSETEQKKRIALLFDLNKMKNEQNRAVNKLKKMQMASGGFPWFNGARYENRYITQYIVAGFGHLNKLGALENESLKNKSENMLNKAISYLDNEILKDYNDLLRLANKIYANDTEKSNRIKEFLMKNNTSNFQIHYLYVRSFFKNRKIPKNVKKAFDYYTNQSFKYWNDYSLYNKGMIALNAKRSKNNAVADDVLHSLKENAITSDELGMYWKENINSYYWYQAPIETQALMIETFSEIGNNIDDVDNLKIWLLKNKQTNRWKTTKATTEAVYALLLQGTDWISTTKFVSVTIGNKTIKPLELQDTKVEAGTGYYKTSWNGKEITPKMAEVTIKKEGKGIAWGAMYWQYFENLDKITMAETPLKLKKKLFVKTNEDNGELITEITDKTKLKLGDLVRVRIELRVDRPMEFIHMKDMRAAGFEPVNVLSQYKWQDGLGYYESTKDASTNFFIDYLPKGVYVFEYDLRVNNKGNFSNGITTIQSMYAPEFSSHSKGVRIVVE